MSWTQDCGTTGFRPDMARCNFTVPLAKKANFVINQPSMQEKEKYSQSAVAYGLLSCWGVNHNHIVPLIKNR